MTRSDGGGPSAIIVHQKSQTSFNGRPEVGSCESSTIYGSKIRHFSLKASKSFQSVMSIIAAVARLQ